MAPHRREGKVVAQAGAGAGALHPPLLTRGLLSLQTVVFQPHLPRIAASLFVSGGRRHSTYLSQLAKDEIIPHFNLGIATRTSSWLF